jgi:hypothetical protein
MAAPAAAQNTQSWVASTGSDSNACTRAAPCANFTRALNVTNAGGTISCVDRLGSGSVTIGKSITIDCEPGGVIRNTTNGIAVLINGNATTVVHLRGLVLDGQTTGGTGIRIIAGRKLFIDHVTIRDFQINGIYLQTSTAALDVTVADTIITNIGRSSPLTGDGGIGIFASGTVDLRLAVVRSTIATGGNSAGIYAQTTGSGGTGVSVTVRDSAVTGNSSGIQALASGRPVRVAILGSQVSASIGVGIAADGAASSIVARKTRITGNGTGVSTTTGGTVLSAGANVLAGNGTDGAFSGTVAAQ